MPTVCTTEHETTSLHRENHGVTVAAPPCGAIGAKLVRLVRRFVQAQLHLLALSHVFGLPIPVVQLARGLLFVRVLVSLLAIGQLLALMIAQVLVVMSALVRAPMCLLVLAQQAAGTLATTLALTLSLASTLVLMLALALVKLLALARVTWAALM